MDIKREKSEIEKSLEKTNKEWLEWGKEVSKRARKIF